MSFGGIYHVLLYQVVDMFETFIISVVITYFEGKRLQHVALGSGREQDDCSLRTVHVPVHIDALTLQQLQATLVRKHLNTESMSLTTSTQMKNWHKTTF